MVLVKNLKFCERFVLSKYTEKKSLVTFFLENKIFWQYKHGFKNKTKIGIFTKGIVHAFGQKFEVFSSFVFIKNRSRKSVC